MGIERFFSTLSNISTLWDKNIYPYNKLNPKILLIDFNSIVHFVSARVLSTLSKDIIDSKIIEDKILLQVKNYLDHLLKYDFL